MLRAVSGLTRGQVGALVSPGVRAGVTLGPDIRGTPAAATAIAADLLYAHPVQVPETADFVGVCLSVGTAVPGTTAKMGLYYAAARGLIGTLIEECAGTLDMNSTANAVLQANFTATRRLAAGFYWPACKFDGAAMPFTMGGGGLMGSGTVLMYGAPNLAPFTRSVGSGAVYTRATVASTYATAFPAAPVLAFGTGSPSVPIMGLVAA